MAVPWTQLIRWAPQIISLSRELLQRSQRVPKTTEVVPTEDRSVDLQRRIAALEENERSQAELVGQMAEQQAELARAVFALHRRERLLIVAIVVLAGLMVWALLKS
jgi:hypothetical protein